LLGHSLWLQVRTMKYELWQSDSESSYSFFASGDKANADMLPIDARLIWTVEADSWEEACRRQHEFLGWEPYKPM
jgi:hypothetical protein